MSLFRRNIIEQTFPCARVVVSQNYNKGRVISVLPLRQTYPFTSVFRLALYYFTIGKDLGNYNYWCLNVVRVSAAADFFRLTTLCPTIINGVYHDTGYTWNVGNGSPANFIWEGFIIALDKSYNNYS